MRRILPLVLVFVASCAPAPVRVDCICVTFVEKASVEGDFLQTIDAIEVESGDYVAPALPTVAAPITFHFEEQWLLGELGEAALVVRVTSHFQVVHSVDVVGGCCGTEWDGASIDTTPRPWNERNAARVDWSAEVGNALTNVDPTVIGTGIDVWMRDPALAHPAFETDDDGRGFVTNAWYEVHAPGCETEDCRSVVRVQRHFRRPA